MSYALVQDIRDRGVSVEDADDAAVQSVLDRATIAINSYCRRDFLDRTVTYDLDGTGRRILFFDDRPVISITSIKVDTILLNESDYRVYRDEGYVKMVGYTKDLYVRLAGVFSVGEQNVEVIGHFGFESVPAETKEACILLALDILKNRASESDVTKATSGTTDRATGVKSVKVGDIAVSFQYPTGALTARSRSRTTGLFEADRLLLKYRKDLEVIVV